MDLNATPLSPQLLLNAVTAAHDTLVPQMDTDTFETNVPNLFVAGGAVAGRHTGNIFIENGRFHGEKIIATITDRVRAAE